MKKSIILNTSLLILHSLFAATTVSDVAISQIGKKAEISYTLSGDPAVVTMVLSQKVGETWTPLSDTCFHTLVGDVNCLVKAGARKAHWNVAADIPNAQIGELKATVEAWPTNALPDYMSVSLDCPDDAPRQGDPVHFYRSAEAVPGGVSDRRYKTTEFLMRKIPAKDVTWMCGDNSAGGDSSRDTKRYVKLSYDYYIGVYEFTFGQYSNFWAKASKITGSAITGRDADTILTNTKAKSDPDYAVCPLTFTSVDDLRGNSKTGDYAIPAANRSHKVDPARFLGKLRTAAGHGLEFDVPTEAQWEYACRAGTWTSYYYGSSYDSSKGWAMDTAEGIKHPVGMKDANPWGLYDIYGNAAEMCLDNWERVPVGNLDKENPIVDPCGENADVDTSIMYRRPTRGGGFSLEAYYSKTCYRYRMPDGDSPYAHIGVRFVCPAWITK